MSPTGEPLRIGAYPRDDVRLPPQGMPRGTATVRVGGDVVDRLELGDLRIVVLDVEAGVEVEVDIEASNDARSYAETTRFRVTRDEEDVVTATVGPGIVVERGRWGRKVESGFEFGVLVMGAVLVDPRS